MGSEAVFTLTLNSMAGPEESVEGTPVTETQVSAAVTDCMVKEPPPAFVKPADALSTAGFENEVSKESRLFVSDSFGSGALMFNDTRMVFTAPAHGLEARQAAVMVVSYTPDVDDMVNASAARAM